MNDLDDAFARLLGRQATDGERQRLYRAREALNLKSTDSVWLLLMALGHYETLYEKIPEQIADAAREATATAKATSEAHAKAAWEQTRRTMTDAVQKAAMASARQATAAQLLTWVSVAISVAVISLTVTAIWQFRRGEAAGMSQGEIAAKTECERTEAAASWANTPEGHLAYDLAKAGSLRDLATCSGRGLAVRDGWCLAQPDRGRPYRWRLGSSGATK